MTRYGIDAAHPEPEACAQVDRILPFTAPDVDSEAPWR